jgi:hypothetical protein
VAPLLVRPLPFGVDFFLAAGDRGCFGLLLDFFFFAPLFLGGFGEDDFSAAAKSGPATTMVDVDGDVVLGVGDGCCLDVVIVVAVVLVVAGITNADTEGRVAKKSTSAGVKRRTMMVDAGKQNGLRFYCSCDGDVHRKALVSLGGNNSRGSVCQSRRRARVIN